MLTPVLLGLISALCILRAYQPIWMRKSATDWEIEIPPLRLMSPMCLYPAGTRAAEEVGRTPIEPYNFETFHATTYREGAAINSTGEIVIKGAQAMASGHKMLLAHGPCFAAIGAMAIEKLESRVDANRNHQIVRRLGSMERYQAANHYQNNVVGICVSCQYTIPTSLASSPRKLRHAIDLAVSRVILQHPMLRVGMIGEGSRKPAWIQLAEIDLSQLIHWHTIDKDTDYLLFSQHILETQLDTKFSNIETCPPWRLVVLQQEASNFIEIMFIFHHSVSDGVGGKLFHASLFRNLNSSAADEQLPSLTNGVLELTHAAKQLEHFPPSQTDMCKYPVSLGYALEKLWKVRAPPCAISDKEFRAAWAPILLSPRKTRTHRISLRDSEVQSLLRVCRKNNTTLTGLIHGIMLVTLAFTLHEEEASAFTAGTAMDMRPFTPPSPSKYPWLQPRETLANIVSGVRHEFSPILVARARSSIKASLTQSDPKPALAEALWSIAAVSRRQIEEAIKLGVRNNVAGLMSTVSDWHAYVAAQAKKPRVCSWNITNLGVFEPESPDRGRVAPSKSWGIKQASFTVCSQHIDNAILLSLIKAKDGDLVIDVVRQDGIFEDGLASDVSNALEDWLSYFASVGSEKVEAS